MYYICYQARRVLNYTVVCVTNAAIRIPDIEWVYKLDGLICLNHRQRVINDNSYKLWLQDVEEF